MKWYSPVDSSEVRDTYNFDTNVLDTHATKTHSPLLTFDQYRQRRLSRSLTHTNSDSLNNDHNFALSPFYKNKLSYENHSNNAPYKPYTSYNNDFKSTFQDFYKKPFDTLNSTNYTNSSYKNDWLSNKTAYFRDQDNRVLDRVANSSVGSTEIENRRSGVFDSHKGLNYYGRNYQQQIKPLGEYELSPYESKIAKIPMYNNVTVNTSYPKQRSHELSDLEIFPLYKRTPHRTEYKNTFNYSPVQRTNLNEKTQGYTFYNPDTTKRSYHGKHLFRTSNLTPNRSERSDRSEVLGTTLQFDENKWKRQKTGTELNDRTPNRNDKTSYLANHEDTRYVSPPYDFDNIGIFDNTPVKRNKPYTPIKTWSTNSQVKNFSTINF